MRSRQTRITDQRAEALLFPIAAFLRAGGLSQKNALSRLAAAFRRAGSLVGVRRIEHIGQPLLYADVVTAWGRDSRFIDTHGRPRPLSLQGRNEFSTLVRSVSSKSDPGSVLRVLIRFGNVRRAGRGKYKLVRPLFFTSTKQAVAFEPVAYFLSDATSTLERILRRTSRSRHPELFWRKVESARLSPASAREFVEFVRERSQSFLEEIDEWLESKADRVSVKRRGGKLRRVGLGVFSIDSNADLVRLTEE